MKLRLPFLFFLISFSFLNAQSIEIKSSASIAGLVASSDELPFWLYSNTRGRIDETTNFSTFINGEASYKLSEKSQNGGRSWITLS